MRARRRLRAWTDGARKIASALVGGKSFLRRRRPQPPEKAGRKDGAGRFRQPFSEDRGLIEPPREETARVQRRRGENAGGRNETRARPNEPTGEKRRKIRSIRMFEPDDQRMRRVIVNDGRARAIEGRRIGDASPAFRAGAVINGERSAAARAERFIDETDFLPRGGAERAGARHGFVSNRTNRRQQRVKHADARTPDNRIYVEFAGPHEFADYDEPRLTAFANERLITRR